MSDDSLPIKTYRWQMPHRDWRVRDLVDLAYSHGLRDIREVGADTPVRFLMQRII